MNVRPSSWGALAGAFLGVFWLIWDWRFLWILLPILIGVVLGWMVEHRAHLGEKLKEILRVVSR